MSSTYESLQTRSVGSAHEPHPKFQITSFTCHFREQSPRYHSHRQNQRSSENAFQTTFRQIIVD
ncbi:hypothetical protein CYK00_05780 [Neisseria sicca]|uniref:Uncharacterized protein n=1 Tax=Neisseria sicca TaxID=490 RepID=A0A2I1XC43_NEISI|nr:hypothetical protein CYK00_05780 [Neisseria sicca]